MRRTALGFNRSMRLMVMTLGVPMAELTMEQNFVKGVHTGAFSDIEVRIKGRKWVLSYGESLRSKRVQIGTSMR